LGFVRYGSKMLLDLRLDLVLALLVNVVGIVVVVVDWKFLSIHEKFL
jgi:hypothetical protein